LEDELKHRLTEDGVKIDKKNFAAALAVLEENGGPGGYDTGRLRVAVPDRQAGVQVA